MTSEILIIDDSDSLRMHLRGILEEAGYGVTEAIHGRDALEKLRLQKYRLILCDVIMPEMDGLEFVDTVKKNELYRDFRFIPIIMLTTIDEEEKKLSGQLSGVKAWIVKPFHPEMVVKAVERLALKNEE